MSIQDRITERKWKSDKEVSLKPCPCCGSENVKLEEGRTNRVICLFCGIQTPCVSSITIAVGLWNRRPNGN